MVKREKRGERKRKCPVWNWIMALPCGTLTSELILIIRTRSTSFSDTLNFELFISKSSLPKNAHCLRVLQEKLIKAISLHRGYPGLSLAGSPK